MSGRRALVVGCRHGPANSELVFAEELAVAFAEAIKGSWDLHDGAVLLDPDAETLRKAIGAAVLAASREEQTLLLHYIGHGDTAQWSQRSAFYLRVRGCEPNLNSETSVNLLQVLSESLGNVGDPLTSGYGPDGVILLLDACNTDPVPLQALESWSGLVRGRMELLLAASDSAYDGCFTKTLIRLVQNGIPRADESLHPLRLRGPIGATCTSQVPIHLSFANQLTREGTTFDEGLWVAPNKARVGHALSDDPTGEVVDRVVRDITLSPTQRRAHNRIEDRRGDRLRLLTGPAGSGKSAISGTLIGPRRDHLGQLEQSPIDCAYLFDRLTDPITLPNDLAEQLVKRLPGLKEARAAVRGRIAAGLIKRGEHDSLDLDLILPLQELLDDDSDPVQMLLDGLDQVDPRQMDWFTDAIRRLTTTPGLEQLRVIATLRADHDPTPLDDIATRIDSPLPTWSEIHRALPETIMPPNVAAIADEPVSGGWLTASLITSLDPASTPDVFDLPAIAVAYLDTALIRTSYPEATEAAIALLSVTGLGPALPLIVLERGLLHLGHDLSTPEVRDILVNLGPLVQRGQAGTPHEHVGFSHAEIQTTFSNRLQ